MKDHFIIFWLEVLTLFVLENSDYSHLLFFTFYVLFSLQCLEGDLCFWGLSLSCCFYGQFLWVRITNPEVTWLGRNCSRVAFELSSIAEEEHWSISHSSPFLQHSIHLFCSMLPVIFPKVAGIVISICWGERCRGFWCCRVGSFRWRGRNLWGNLIF